MKKLFPLLIILLFCSNAFSFNTENRGGKEAIEYGFADGFIK